MTDLEAEREALKTALFEVQDLVNVVRLICGRPMHILDAPRLLAGPLARLEHKMCEMPVRTVVTHISGCRSEIGQPCSCR